MRLAVTGARGFLGRHVTAELARRGLAATLVRRPGSAPPETAAPSHRWVEMDLAQPPADAYDRLGRPEALIHLAWGGLPNYRALHHLEEELPAQYGFLSRLVKAGLGRLVVTGTCLEYGMQSGPLDESLALRPTTPYGYAKEALCRQLGFLKQEYGFGLAWARLFYLYGEGQAANSLWPQLKQAALRGDARFNMSGGEQLRDYLPVEKVAEYLVALALADTDPGAVNVCSGVPISVRRLVEGWIAEQGWRIQPNLGYYPYPDYEPMAFWGCRRKLDACLGLD